jgi:hypothetical protein
MKLTGYEPENYKDSCGTRSDYSGSGRQTRVTEGMKTVGTPYEEIE